MPRRLLTIAVPVLLLALAGCEALQTGAPPVTSTMVRIARESGGSAEDLAVGRRLLAQRCTNCHSLEPIAKYSVSEWRTNVLKMSDRAGLDANEIRQITGYLVAARNSLP